MRKRYDTPKTPRQRVLAPPDVSAEKKAAIDVVYRSLDLGRLKAEMERIRKAWSVCGKRGAQKRVEGVQKRRPLERTGRQPAYA